MNPDVRFDIDRKKFPTAMYSRELLGHLKKYAEPAAKDFFVIEGTFGCIFRQELPKGGEYLIHVHDFLLTQELQLFLEAKEPVVFVLMTMQGRITIDVPRAGLQTIEANQYNIFHFTPCKTAISCYKGNSRIFCLCMTPDTFKRQATDLAFFTSSMQKAKLN